MVLFIELFNLMNVRNHNFKSRRIKFSINLKINF